MTQNHTPFNGENKKKCVLVFSTAYLPLLGGAELAVKNVTDRIHEFTFILVTARIRRNLPRRERIGNVEVYRIGIGVSAFDKLLLPVSGIFLTRRLMRNYSVCLFWGAMASYASVIPAILILFRLNKNISFLLTLQEGDSEEHIAGGRFGLIRIGWRFLLKRATHVQVISSYLDRMAREYGYTGKITLVPNGVDIDIFQIKKQKKKKVIITVSRLVEKNGVDTLITAFAEVKKHTPLAELHIVGDGPLRAKLEVLARIEGVGKAVTFMGIVEHRVIPEKLAEAYMFVRPSRSEGLGTAFLEAMAVGIPVIGTPVGGIVDFLRDGETGLLCRVDDPVYLAGKIITLFENDMLCSKLRNNAQRLVEEQYTWDTAAEQMKTIFKTICES
jgi:glycosyltransferase involved in cell wall biosynthesis